MKVTFLIPMTELVAAHLDQAIDHQERIAVRQQFQKAENVRRFDRPAGHSSSPRGNARRASLRVVAIPRNHSRLGRAG